MLISRRAFINSLEASRPVITRSSFVSCFRNKSGVLSVAAWGSLACWVYRCAYSPQPAVKAVRASESQGRPTRLTASQGELRLPRRDERGSPATVHRAARSRSKLRDNCKSSEKWGTARDPRQAGAPAAAPTAVPAVLDKEYTFSQNKKHFIPLADSCYRSLLEQRPTAAGKVHFFFSIVGDETIGGVVESVDLEDERTTMDEPDFLYCVRESMLSVQFDPPPKYGRATIGFDLEFAPGSDEPDGGT